MKVIRISELASTKTKQGLIPCSKSSIWRWVKLGKFPKPFTIGENVTVWSAEQVEQWINQHQLTNPQ